MSMNKTQQNGYADMRGDITIADTTMHPETEGITFQADDRPSGAFPLGPECNACEMIFPCYDGVDNKIYELNVWGYGVNGPAEFMCDLSLTTGLARVVDVTTSLYVDTINIGTQSHIKTISVADGGGSARISKVAFDCVGLSYLYIEAYEVTTNTSIRPLIRTF